MSAEKRNTQLSQQLQQELVDFTYIVSHDLSAPIRHIEQFSMLLSQRLADRNVLNAEEQQFLDILKSSSHRARAMVAALHKLSRLNTAEMEWSSIDLPKLLGRIQTELSRNFRDQNFLMIFDDSVQEIEADKNSFHFAISAVIENAIRFASSDTPTEITIHSQPNGDNIEIDITDNGKGISSDLAERVFQCFFQENPDKNDLDHLGVGLTGARRAIRRHHGDITIECGSNDYGWPRIRLPIKQSGSQISS